MGRNILLWCLSLFVVSAFAANNTLVLNKVTFSLRAEQWVSTQTAKVVVRVDGALNEQEIATAHSTITAKLTQLSNKASWHIVMFRRSQSKSGLEQIQASAVARLSEAELAPLRDRAKGLSRPGLSFTIANIDFSPTLKEVERVRSELREKIYAEAKAELARLNKLYPQQHYYLYSIDFIGKMPARSIGAANMELLAYKAGAPSAALSVSSKEFASAIVVLASS